ncbi:unnamed protein product [Euphydryas editha]|uniref:Gustatory receptor n=1 Tax=Euphydryas editha TaxID=104508 RepID=A0AAU9V8M1_EUPED|nr:unnamed protein product [Euphydryas editha]
MSTRIIKKIVVIENFMCVYRNYNSLSKASRLMLWLRLLLIISLYAIDVFIRINYFLNHNLRRIMNFFLNVITSCAIIILALYQSKKYEILLRYFAKNSSLFSKDALYTEKLDRIYKIVIIFHVFNFIISIAIQIFNNISDENTFNSTEVMHSLMMVMCNNRFMAEYIFLWTLLSILTEQVKFITRKIFEEIVTPVSKMEWESEEIVVIEHEVTSFNEWRTVYNDIKECSNLINSIFGLQITVFLLVTTFYLLIFLYSVVLNIVFGLFLKSVTFGYIIKNIIFLAAIVAFCRSAQAAQNSVTELNYCLGKVLIHSLATYNNKKLYKETKDFLHLISSRPIRTQAFGSINIDMMLLPKFIMFLTSHTIIALQLNNVL